jgi:hypothetical protein
MRSDAEPSTSRLARLGVQGEHDDATRVGGAAEPCHRTVRHRVVFLVRLPLNLRDTAELALGRRRNEFDARGRLEHRLLAGHQRESSFDLEFSREQHGFDGRRDGRDVLEPRLSLARLIGGDEGLDVGRGGDPAVIRDRVVEIRVRRVAREGCEERADSFGLASTRGVVTKRFLDPA